MDADDARYAWAAGLIDGEGAIHFQRQHKGAHRVYIVLSVTMLGRETVETLASIFGGRARTYDQRLWQWHLYSANAIEALQLMQPYLVTKGRHAALALEWWRQRSRLRPESDYASRLAALQIKGGQRRRQKDVTK